MSSDAELFEAWRAGQDTAGEVLFERYYPVLLRFFANKVGDDPMDLIHETFLGCISGRQRLRSTQSFRPFLFSIAYNQLKKHYERERSAETPVDLSTMTSLDLSPGPGTMLAKSAEQRLLLDALRRIPVEHQVVLELFYWEGYTSAQISEVLTEPHGTIRTRIRRARQLLEKAMEEVASEPKVYEDTRSDLDGWAAKVRELYS